MNAFLIIHFVILVITFVFMCSACEITEDRIQEVLLVTKKMGSDNLLKKIAEIKRIDDNSEFRALSIEGLNKLFRNDEIYNTFTDKNKKLIYREKEFRHREPFLRIYENEYKGRNGHKNV